MWSNVLVGCSIFSIAVGQIKEPQIDRQFSDNVKTDGYKVLYGDQEMTVVNQVVQEYEKSELLKSKADPERTIQQLPAMDVKCLMSVDSYCTKDMLDIKKILIQALKENCKKCSDKEKEKAGRVIASMMTFDKPAWKLFLTRSAVQLMPQRSQIPLEDLSRKMKVVGKPEFVENKRNRHVKRGVNVKVHRCVNLASIFNVPHNYQSSSAAYRVALPLVGFVSCACIHF